MIAVFAGELLFRRTVKPSFGFVVWECRALAGIFLGDMSVQSRPSLSD